MDSGRQRGRHSNYMIVCTDNYLQSRPLTVIKELSECCLMEALRGGGGGEGLTVHPDLHSLLF